MLIFYSILYFNYCQAVIQTFEWWAYYKEYYIILCKILQSSRPYLVSMCHLTSSDIVPLAHKIRFLAPETEPFCQFLAPEILLTHFNFSWGKKLKNNVSFWARKLNYFVSFWRQKFCWPIFTVSGARNWDFTSVSGARNWTIMSVSA